MFGSMLSIELTKVSDKFISMSPGTTVSDNLMSTASGPFPPDEDPNPNKAARTFFTSFPLPGLTEPSSSSPHEHALLQKALASWELQCSPQPSPLSLSLYVKFEKDLIFFPIWAIWPINNNKCRLVNSNTL